ncbi:hypothetical protein [Streptomyces sp. YS415]|uniref:hypothetical protein n=1 Tax=Streptomyces sp. YS415 TaxID=2944806 RepID=UPI002021D4D5|nr:hypothetical protein [Streptomyces sp. YS415]MCL7427114.1 hypothetical protein [Streptomyces sp. YS415]
MIDASNDVYILLVLALGLGGMVATVWLAIRAAVLLTRAGRHRTLLALLRASAALTWMCAVGVYTWGALHLMLLDESSQAQECAERLTREQVKSVEGYEYSFVPLRFTCRVAGGQTYDAVVPGYVNPAAAILSVSAAVLTAITRSHSQRKEITK